MTVGLPESAEQIKFAPIRALRSVFSGVGHLLMAADRLKAEDAELPRFRSLDSTGNVRLLNASDLADMAEDDLDRRILASRAEAAAAPAQAVSYEPPDYSTPVSGQWAYDLTADNQQAVAEVSRAARELPVPGYDDLSLPSLRARLRNLDVAQLRQLVLYEISHAYRPDVVSMFERRIVKLQGSQDSDD